MGQSSKGDIHSLAVDEYRIPLSVDFQLLYEYGDLKICLTASPLSVLWRSRTKAEAQNYPAAIRIVYMSSLGLFNSNFKHKMENSSSGQQ